MALKFTSLVWQGGPATRPFLVLLTLAELPTLQAYAGLSIEIIAARSRLSKSTVICAMGNSKRRWLVFDGVRRVGEHKGNTYQIALHRLDSRFSVTPDLFESSVTVTPYTPIVRCHPVLSQVSLSAESGHSGNPPAPPNRYNCKEP